MAASVGEPDPPSSLAKTTLDTVRGLSGFISPPYLLRCFARFDIRSVERIALPKTLRGKEADQRK